MIKLYDGKFANEINYCAGKYGVDPFLIAAIIEHESNFDKNAQSPVGSRGLMGVMPQLFKKPWDSIDSYENINAGTKHLKWLLKYFKDDLYKAVAAYNTGTKSVDKYDGVPPYEQTKFYVAKVMNTYLNNTVAV